MSSKSLKDESTNSFFEALYKDKDAEAHQIADGLFLGSAAAAADRKAMQKRGVSHVLICHPVLPEPHPQHFRYGRAPLVDAPTENLLEKLPDALEFLGAAVRKGRVFVFCMKGISRSSSIVIAFLMLEKGLGFEEAWKLCEQKRPIVYPNIGFQQQLRHFEAVLARGDPSAPREEKLKRLRFELPAGSLEAPAPELRVRDLIGDSMRAHFDEVEALAERIFSQPQLLQKREQWKRHGLYFENLHKYKTLPSDVALVSRGKAAAEKLGSLPKVFSDSLKGVKLATAVASQISSWVEFAEPRLTEPAVENEDKEQEQDDAPKERSEIPIPDFVTQINRRPVEEPEGKDKLKKSKEKEKKSKQSKKEKKLKKQEKKNRKKEKKAAKEISKIERLAKLAEDAANEASQKAQRESDAAEALDAELAKLEADEQLDAADAAHDRATKERAAHIRKLQASKEDARPPSGSSSSSSSSGDSGQQKKKRKK